MKKVYLAGPINGCTDDECKTWREFVKTKLPFTLDPMDRDYRGREDDCSKEIVEGDKADILAADTVLVWYPKPSTGTDMEIFFSWENDKNVVVVVPPGSKISPWLKYHSDYITERSMQDAIDYITRYYKNQEEKEAISNVLGVFSQAMMDKLIKKVNSGQKGWNYSGLLPDLKKSLKDHLEKGDMVDVANLAMFIWNIESNTYLMNIKGGGWDGDLENQA
jgi:hypothetical protein